MATDKFGFSAKYGANLKVSHVDGSGLLSGKPKYDMGSMKLLSEHKEHNTALFVDGHMKNNGIISMVLHNPQKMPKNPFEVHVHKEHYIKAYKLYQDLLKGGKVD